MKKLFILIVLFCLLSINFYFKSSKTIEIKVAETWSANDEWQQVSRYGFLRKETAQYLHDKKELLIFFLYKNQKKMSVEELFELFVNVSYNGALFSQFRIAPNITQHFYYNLYQVNFLKTDFDLDSVFYKRTYNLNDVKIKISIRGDSQNKYNQDVLIDVRIKYYRDKQKTHQSTIICVEPIFLKSDQFPDFQWFVEMAKLSGYKKIALYNNSIENCDIFNNFFDVNKNFFDIYKFYYLPDLTDAFGNGTYVRHVNDLIKEGGWDGVNWDFDKAYFLGLDAVAYHDCLYKYSDEFKYVIIQDPDELVIPNRLKPFGSYDEIIRAFDENKREDLCENRIDSGILNNYLDSLYANYKIPKNQSLYFKPIYYMNPVTVKELIEELVKYLNKFKQKSKKKFPFSFNFVDPIHPQVKYIYTVNNSDEYNYVSEMVKIYKKLIEPFLVDNEVAINQKLYNFNEIFYMSKNIVSNYSFGKSFSNPDTAVQNQPHFPLKNYYTLDQDKHFISHFRHRNNKLINTTASITNIKIDLNYFICYYIPILEKLTKQN